MKESIKNLLRIHKGIIKNSSIFSSIIENIVIETSIDTEIGKEKIRMIISAQFRMVADVIYSSTERDLEVTPEFECYKSIRLIYLGSFMPSRSKYNKLLKILKVLKQKLKLQNSKSN